MKTAVVWTIINNEEQNIFFGISLASFLEKNRNNDVFLFTNFKEKFNHMEKYNLNIIDFKGLSLTQKEQTLINNNPLIAWTILPMNRQFKDYDFLVFVDNDTIFNFEIDAFLRNISINERFSGDAILTTRQFHLRFLSRDRNYINKIFDTFKKNGPENCNLIYNISGEDNEYREYIRIHSFRILMSLHWLTSLNKIKSNWSIKANGAIWFVNKKIYVDKFPDQNYVFNFHFKTLDFLLSSGLNRKILSDEDFVFVNFYDSTHIIEDNLINIMIKDLDFENDNFPLFKLLHFVDPYSKSFILELFNLLSINPGFNYKKLISTLGEKYDFKKLLIDNDNILFNNNLIIPTLSDDNFIELFLLNLIKFIKPSIITSIKFIN